MAKVKVKKKPGPKIGSKNRVGKKPGPKPKPKKKKRRAAGKIVQDDRDSRGYRTKDQRTKDLRTISTMSCQGYTQRQIAGEVGLSSTMVNRELQSVRKVWKESAKEKIAEAKSRVLAELRMLKITYWKGYMDSS